MDFDIFRVYFFALYVQLKQLNVNNNLNQKNQTEIHIWFFILLIELDSNTTKQSKRINTD